MAVDRPHRSRVHHSTSSLLAIAVVLFASVAARAQAPDRAKAIEGFDESRRGDVPEGTLEMMTPETDKAITLGLVWRWLGNQHADGSFGTGSYRNNIAVTSVAGLAFMSSGSSPGRGPYGPQIDKALVFVMDNTSPSGFIAVAASSTHGPMYSHGFGTLFLAEAYGMTHRPEIREKLQKAVRLIVDSQNIEGGWRYQPRKADADLSVTICQINALRAARNAGLFVPKETVDACIRYVKQAQNADGGFRYQLQRGFTSAFPRSAAGVVALQSAGEYDSKEVREGIAYLRQFGQGQGQGLAGSPQPQQSLFLWPVLCGSGDVDPGWRGLGRMVSGQTQRSARSPVGVRFLGGRQRLQRIWHSHGADHPSDTQRLLAHLSTLTGRAGSVLSVCRQSISLHIRAVIASGLLMALVAGLTPPVGRRLIRLRRFRPIRSSRGCCSMVERSRDGSSPWARVRSGWRPRREPSTSWRSTV